MSSHSIKRKLFWCFLLLCGFAFAITHLTILTLRYCKYGSSYIVDRIQGAQIDFPFVTVCPNVVPLKHIDQLYRYDPSMSQSKKSWKNQFLRNLKFPSDLHDHFNSWIGYIENFPSTLRYNVLECKDIVLYCSYQGKSCSCDNFNVFVDRENIAKCYTFNATTITKNKMTRYAKAGLGNGLSLVLGEERLLYEKTFNLDDVSFQYDFENSYGFGNGFTIQIHPHDTIPTPFNHGFDISTFQSTSVTLKAKLAKKLPFPYSNCSNDFLKLDKTSYRRTLFTCSMVCLQQQILQSCGCLSSVLPAVNKFVRYCGRLKNWTAVVNLDDTDRKEFIENITKPWKCEQEIIRNPIYNCNCISCDEESFDHTVSAYKWPDKKYVPNLLSQLLKTLPSDLRHLYNKITKFTRMGIECKDTRNRNCNSSENGNAFYKNEVRRLVREAQTKLARVNIYLEDLDAVMNKEVASYPITNLMADVGGALGLWVGISALSLMEMVELFSIIICSMKQARRGDDEV